MAEVGLLLTHKKPPASGGYKMVSGLGLGLR